MLPGWRRLLVSSFDLMCPAEMREIFDRNLHFPRNNDTFLFWAVNVICMHTRTHPRTHTGCFREMHTYFNKEKLHINYSKKYDVWCVKKPWLASRFSISRARLPTVDSYDRTKINSQKDLCRNNCAERQFVRFSRFPAVHWIIQVTPQLKVQWSQAMRTRGWTLNTFCPAVSRSVAWTYRRIGPCLYSLQITYKRTHTVTVHGITLYNNTRLLS
jgi:hypothetical protein